MATGKWRVFRKSIRFTFRNKKRFLVFLLIFGIVSTIIALNIDDLDSLFTDDLLDQKGVVITKSDAGIVTYDQGNDLLEQVKQFAQESPDTDLEASAIYYYADIDPFLRLNSLEIDKPWMSDFANPSLLQSGRFPSSTNEILVPAGSTQTRNISESATIKTQMAVGQEITFYNGVDEIKLEIVGTFDNTEHQISNPNNQLWLFMDTSVFLDVLELYSMDPTTSVNTYMMSFLVEGFILSSTTHQKANVLNAQVEEFIADEVTYGDWNKVADSLPTDQAQAKASQIIVSLLFVVVGGMVLSILFAYLISRFRRREIAILKAMGYTHGGVRTTLFGEILTTSFMGFTIGLSSAQLLLIYLNQSLDAGNFIRIQAIAISFIVMVLISIPGMYVASVNILRVSPAEAFRDK